MSDEPQSSDGTDQLRVEIKNVLERACKESDLTLCQILGVLEIVKFEVVEQVGKISE